MVKKKKKAKKFKKTPVIHVTNVYLVEEKITLLDRIKGLVRRIARLFKRK